MRSNVRLLPNPVAAKVPEITVLFWVIKVLTTGMGEAASDFLAAHDLVLAAALGLIGFAVGMAWQFRVQRYQPAAYWFAVAMVALFGTMAADGLHKGVGIPYTVTTVGYAVALAAIFVVWQRCERTLSIHSITTRRRETFYWLTVLATFALGTAAGDLTAFTLHLGYAESIVLFAAAIAVPAVAYARGWMNSVAAFWTAYVLTRPLGASMADWLGKPHALRGLGYGDGTVTVVASLLIAGLVAHLARTGRDVQAPAAAAGVVGRPRGREALAQASDPGGYR
jgi:uncharacterized membrane-anchored protein